MARKKIIPKRIGSVKIPKNLRRIGDRVLSDPRSREVASAALLSLGAALASRGIRRSSVLRDIFEPSGEAARPGAASPAGETVSGVAGALNAVVGEVIETVRRDIGRKFGQPPAEPAAAAEPPKPADAKDDRVH